LKTTFNVQNVRFPVLKPQNRKLISKLKRH